MFFSMAVVNQPSIMASTLTPFLHTDVVFGTLFGFLDHSINKLYFFSEHKVCPLLAPISVVVVCEDLVHVQLFWVAGWMKVIG